MAAGPLRPSGTSRHTSAFPHRGPRRRTPCVWREPSKYQPSLIQIDGAQAFSPFFKLCASAQFGRRFSAAAARRDRMPYIWAVAQDSGDSALAPKGALCADRPVTARANQAKSEIVGPPGEDQVLT